MSVQQLEIGKFNEKTHPYRNPAPTWNSFDWLPFARTQTSGQGWKYRLVIDNRSYKSLLFRYRLSQTFWFQFF